MTGSAFVMFDLICQENNWTKTICVVCLVVRWHILSNFIGARDFPLPSYKPEIMRTSRVYQFPSTPIKSNFELR